MRSSQARAVACCDVVDAEPVAARIREAEARATLAERETYPRPSIGVQYRREGNPTSEGPYDIVMGVLSVPIPSFQRNQGPRAQARADVILTGRVADPALFLAPLMHHHGWAADDWPRLGRGVLVGHLLECAGQDRKSVV